MRIVIKINVNATPILRISQKRLIISQRLKRISDFVLQTDGVERFVSLDCVLSLNPQWLQKWEDEQEEKEEGVGERAGRKAFHQKNRWNRGHGVVRDADR